MRKYILFCAASIFTLAANAQSVTSAFTISQNDLRGTARYMSMAGAFGALGGDLTAITQNPGGIGIYRSNEIGATFGVDINNTKSETGSLSLNDRTTDFNLNNIGAVFTLKLYNNAVPNVNFGFVYNKAASFNRKFSGNIGALKTSFSNYIAGLSNYYGLDEADVKWTSSYDPYNPPYDSRFVPTLSVLGYDAFLTNPEILLDQNNNEVTWWTGQYGEGTTGSGYFDVTERGSVDEYNIILGGNINNKVFIGMNFDITSIDYRIQSEWSESLQGAYVYNPNQQSIGRYDAKWALHDTYRVNGTGFKFNMGVIYKPIQELRLGFAFHTPSFYNLNETFSNVYVNFNYPFPIKDKDGNSYNSAWANDGIPTSNRINFSTPWRLIASVAGVIGSNFIVSADYEWTSYQSMKYSEADPFYYDSYYDWPYDDWGWGWNGFYAPKKAKNSSTGISRSQYTNPNDYANDMIKEIYCNTHTLRLGAEYRVLPSLSVRAGYSFTTSPVSSKAKNEQISIPGTGVLTNYSLDNMTNYVTCGIGYKYKGFYADLAYLYKNMTSEYYPYSPDLENRETAVKSKLTTSNSSLALSIGFKF